MILTQKISFKLEKKEQEILILWLITDYIEILKKKRRKDFSNVIGKEVTGYKNRYVHIVVSREQVDGLSSGRH